MIVNKCDDQVCVRVRRKNDFENCGFFDPFPLESVPDEISPISPTICTIQRDLIRRSFHPEQQTVFTAEEIKMLVVLYVAIKVRVAIQGDQVVVMVLKSEVELLLGIPTGAGVI